MASTPAFSAKRLVWKAISLMTLTMPAIQADERSIRAIASTVCRTTSAESCALFVVSSTSRPASAARRAESDTVGNLGDGRGLLDGRGLRSGAAGKVVGRGTDLARSRCDLRRVPGDRLHRRPQPADRGVVVGAQRFQRGDERLFDRLVQIALGHRLQADGELVDGPDPLADVACELDDLEHLAVHVKNRIIGGLDEHLPAAIADARELVGGELPGREFAPEFLVLAAVCIGGVVQYRVMPSANFLQRITERRQEILVGRQDMTVGRELNRRLRA